MTADFFGRSKATLARWDRDLRIDLSTAPGIQFGLYCENAGPIGHFVIYLGGPDGSHTKVAPIPTAPGWNTISVSKSEMVAEGKAPDWAEIRTMSIVATKASVGVGTFHIASLAVMEPDPMISLTRRADHDCIDLKRGSVIPGTLLNSVYSLNTRFGLISLAPDRVVGLSRVGQLGSNVRVLLTDGQIITGSMKDPRVRLAMTIGEEMDVSVRRVRGCSYKISPAKPAHRPIDTPMVVIGDSRISLGREPEIGFTLRTVHGDVSLTADVPASIEAIDGAANTWRVAFRDGSLLVGELAPPTFAAKLYIDPAAPLETTIDMRQVVRILWPRPEPIVAGAVAVAYLDGDQKVVGRFGQEALTFKDGFGPTPIPASEIISLTFSRIDMGAVTAELWSDVRLKGRLVDKTIAFALLGDGATLHLQVDKILSISNTGVLPSGRFAAKIERLIRKLDSGNPAQRLAARGELIRSGAAAAPVLHKHLGNASNATIRQQVREILAKIQ